MKIAIIGAGISGITHAAVLTRLGHEVIVFEKESTIAGVWAKSYPEVRLQNLGIQYHLSDFEWPEEPDPHPTSEQIRRYLAAVVDKYGFAPRMSTEVTRLEELGEGWRVHTQTADSDVAAEDVGFVIVATGQYTQPKASERLAGVDTFEGDLVSERTLQSLEQFRDKRVAVVGFGKSALDLAAFAARRGASVQHVVRTPRWLLPEKFFGVLHYTFALFTRFGSVLVPCWTQPTWMERALHRAGAPFVRAFWWLLSLGMWRQFRSYSRGHGREGRARIERLRPPHPLVQDMRSAAALAPQDYFEHVAAGRIEPIRGEIERVTPFGLQLKSGETVEAEVLVLATGSVSPQFPFLPDDYRSLLETSPDGVQLYRHILHPRIPNLAFAGFNHGFLHIPASEVGALWIDAVLTDRLRLPSPEAMEAAMDHVHAWKAAHISFEPSRSCAVNTRFQQYLDVMLAELGLSPYRKLPNVIAELFSRYGPKDYAGVVAQYQRRRRRRPRKSLPLPT